MKGSTTSGAFWESAGSSSRYGEKKPQRRVERTNGGSAGEWFMGMVGVRDLDVEVGGGGDGG